METMEEFDKECPMLKTFCKQLTEDEFEDQTLTYTEQALIDLFHTMDENPELYERVIRRRKQDELEKSGAGNCLKAKFFLAVEGQLNRCNAVGSKELRERVGHLKEDMKKVYCYAKEAKCSAKRKSIRVAERREKAEASRENVHHQKLPVAPPPPPPPPPPSTVYTPLKDHTNFRKTHIQMLSTPDLLDSYGLSRLKQQTKSKKERTVPAECTQERCHLTIHSELLATNPLKRLKATGIDRSPGGTPVNTPKKPSVKETMENSPTSAFNTALLTKFQNVRSPFGETVPHSPDSDGDDSCSSNLGFATPPGTP
ncbi:uncharacterized protein LOC114669174 [Erpetoichthys calabaricus]|uniref:uncharacterized protein LOC114669174 n=1 Tax=Erpetoichthys calabaricus TaxID=27687 RepID=UPI0010A0049A|nr:uncharacterized protein LOC114669174 [Erpetoichthys calabaricus]XP_028681167.1 uncharacterized protein LOC114669174 [Erpetoichthys calabaricus]XP_028681168.1 uncharacterized protein LOC114669174 [Erpetoichthys calabaricus]XP_051777544.1 uncharacterized protein LOC114669174 [Erpetoichthys calabaricus]